MPVIKKQLFKNRSHRYITLVYLFCFIISSPSVFSQDQLIERRDHAIFFAVEDYSAHRSWSDLPNPVKDAKLLATELREQFDFSTELYENPSSVQILNTLRSLQTKIFNPNDQLLIFFCGHGALDELTQKGTFISSTMGEQHKISYLREIISQIKCQHILLIIDACFSGAGDPKMIYRGAPDLRRPGDTDASRRKRLISDMLRHKTGLVISSGASRTQDGRDHSPLTEGILRALTAAYTGGDGLLTLRDLESRLERVRPIPTMAELAGHQGGGFVFERKGIFSPPPHLVVDAQDNSHLPPADYDPAKINPIAPDRHVTIKPSSYEMGRDLGDLFFDAKNPHQVNLSGFKVSKYETTFTEFDLFCEETGRDKPDDNGWGRGERPVINVSWYDAIAYCNWLSKRFGKTPVYSINGRNAIIDYSADGFRLPTEAEWEYLASYPNSDFGNSTNIADPQKINFDGSHSFKTKNSISGVSRKKTLPHGSLNAPNALGIHELSGNVAEWCNDRYASDYYAQSPPDNPFGPTIGSRRVVRGGSYQSRPEEIRAFHRSSMAPEKRSDYIGFRLVWKSQ